MQPMPVSYTHLEKHNAYEIEVVPATEDEAAKIYIETYEDLSILKAYYYTTGIEDVYKRQVNFLPSGILRANTNRKIICFFSIPPDICMR